MFKVLIMLEIISLILINIKSLEELVLNKEL